jgi:hypothetical protein
MRDYSDFCNCGSFKKRRWTVMRRYIDAERRCYAILNHHHLWYRHTVLDAWHI